MNWFDTLALNCHYMGLSLASITMQAVIICCHHHPGSRRACLSTLCIHTISTVSAHTLRWFSRGLSVLSDIAPYIALQYYPLITMSERMQKILYFYLKITAVITCVTLFIPTGKKSDRKVPCAFSSSQLAARW